MDTLTPDSVICSKEIATIEDEFSLRRRAWEVYNADGPHKEQEAAAAEVLGMTLESFKRMAKQCEWGSAKTGKRVPFEFLDHSTTPVNTTHKLTRRIPNEDRKCMLRAFAMYLNGMDAWEIALTISVPATKIHYWIGAGSWVKCRVAYQESGVAPDPWHDDSIPLEWADLTEMARVIPEVFKHSMSEIIMGCVTEAKGWDDETKMERINDILKLATAGDKIFGFSKPEFAAQINMITPLNAIEVKQSDGFAETLELENVE